MMKRRKKIAALLTTVAVTGSVVFAATDINPNASVLVGGTTPNQTTSEPNRTRVDVTTGATVLLTPDKDYKPASYPGGHPDNLGKNAPDTARVLIRGERTNFGLNTDTTQTGSAFGANAKAKGAYSASFGNGANVTKPAAEGLAMGHNASVTASNSVAIGSNSTAAEENVVSVGSVGGERRITNIADGRIAAGSHDAVTGNQLYQYGENLTNSLGREIKNVGAASAALAGLHPLDYTGIESRFQIAAALGTYDGRQAVAIGGFYNANPNTLLSFGVASSFGDNHKMSGNIGATFRVGRDSHMSKAQNATVEQRLAAMEREIQDLKAENTALAAKVVQLQK